MEIKQGDFILSRNKKELYRVECVRKQGVSIVYDIETIFPQADILELFDWTTETYRVAPVPNMFMGVSRSHVKHLGNLIAAKDAKVLKILFEAC